MTVAAGHEDLPLAQADLSFTVATALIESSGMAVESCSCHNNHPLIHFTSWTYVSPACYRQLHSKRNSNHL